MSYHSKGKLNCPPFKNTNIVILKDGSAMLNWTLSDYKVLEFLARYHYKLKTKRHRIIKKYVVKMMNRAIREHLKGV